MVSSDESGLCRESRSEGYATPASSLNQAESAFLAKAQFVLRIAHRPRLAVWDPAGGPEHAGAAGRPLHRRAEPEKAHPVMPHRAIFGVAGALHRHPAGAPRRQAAGWLPPVQAVVMNITDKQDDYVTQVVETLGKQGFRVEADLRNEKVGFRFASTRFGVFPIYWSPATGKVAANMLSVRTRSGADLGTMSPDTFV